MTIYIVVCLKVT